MTGTPNSNNLARVLAGLVSLAGIIAPPLVADDVFLEGAERLSGNVRAINANGSVLLETPLAPEPVPLKADSVRKVLFSEPAGTAGAGSCGVTLVNGDVLPGDIEGIDDKNLTLNSSVAGHFVIPRDMVYSLQLGVRQPNALYTGPDGLNGWLREPASAEHWAFADEALQVRGSGKLSREFELPPQFVVRFKLGWENEPNIRFSFAAAPGTGEGARDRYYLQFNAAGIELKREAASGRRYTTIATLNRLPKQYPGKRLTIEVRVDRPGRTLQLYLNDEPEGPFKDPVAKAPAASGIMFESMVEEGATVRISHIEVLDWNLKGERRHTEDRGDVTKDVLIGSKSERFSGTLVAAKKGPASLLYVFKSAFQDEPLEVPEGEISTVFFVGKKDAAATAAKDPFILQLRGGGSLHVASCAFAATQVEATHPLLGRLTLRRDGVAAFERVSAKSKEATEP
jgi:hypothetical protein